MSHYIDGELLANRVKASPLFNNFGQDGAFIQDFVTELIKSQPNVNELRQGYWKEENTRPRSSQFICSECGERAYYVQPTTSKTWKKFCPYKYCPNCGAIMDSERSENKMSVNMCCQCKHHKIITDNHDKLHGMCGCVESEDFLKEVDCAFHSCEYGERDIEEEDE